MKKLTLLTLLVIALSAVSAIKFDPDLFQSRTVIVCFTKDAVGNETGKIETNLENGTIRTGMETFDALAEEFGIVELRQMHPYVKVPTWNDKGIYLQNHYRVILDSDERIDEAVEALAKDKNLIYAELEGINRSKFTPNDPMVTQQYVHSRIRSYEAWDYIMGSYDVKIAITDSGVKWNHPDLRANIWINPAESPGMTINWDAGTIHGGDGVDAGEGGGKIDDLIGWDFVGNDNNPMQNYPRNDHGTHVAGCAAAVGNNGIGVVGTSPIASIISCKGSPDNSPSTGIQYAYDQIKYSAELGADIINASWGSPGSGVYPNSIVNYATALGSLVVTAAGNDNMEHNASYQDYPADCDNVLCVASTGQQDIKSNFSDYGEPIDICAPGEGILSTIIAQNGYDAYDGTSMASPVAAGVCALVKALHPSMTPAQLRQRVMMTADYIYEANPNYIGKLGAGRINAYAATMFDKIPNITIDDTMVNELEGDGDGIPNPGETVQLKVSLNNYLDPYTGLAWLPANGLTATLTTNYPGVTILDDTASFGTLSPGSTMWNNSQPFKFSTVSTLASEPIPFELVISANEDSSFPYNKILPFTVELSLNQDGWPHHVGGASSSSAILYNLDNDPDLEVIFGDPSGKIHAVKADGSSASGFPINAGSAIIGSLAMGNLNSSGNKYFAANLQNNNVLLFNQNAEVLWTVPAGGNLRSGPVIADLANNGQSKIITVTQTGSLVVLNPDGSPYQNFPVALGAPCLGTPAVADLDGDGIHEILVATLNGTLHAINSATGQNIAGFPVTMPGGSQNAITIANIDNDPHPEIIVTTSTTGSILAYNHDGSQIFDKHVGGQIKSSAVVADVNGDGNKEIIVIGASGIVHVLNASGNDLPNTPISIGQAVECTPTVAYFDNDNYAGIIFGDTNGYVHSLRIDGTESPNFPIRINGNVKTSAALADIDRDNDLDIVIPNDDSFYVIDIKRPAQQIPWPCYLGVYNRAGNIMQDTPVQDFESPALVTELRGNYPNPFNPSTLISYTLEVPGHVSLEIYNQKGQLVNTLVNSDLPSGMHQIQWNGRDFGGQPVSSGVYFYRMRSGKYSSTRKMVLMK